MRSLSPADFARVIVKFLEKLTEEFELTWTDWRFTFVNEPHVVSLRQETGPLIHYFYLGNDSEAKVQFINAMASQGITLRPAPNTLSSPQYLQIDYLNRYEQKTPCLLSGN